MTPSVELFGITISEPTTTLTDYLVTAVAWWLGSKLCRMDDARRQATRYWGIGFLLIGLGALLGGTSHALATQLDDTAYAWIWKLTIYNVALSVTFALAGSINGASFGDSSRRILHGLNILVFVTYGTWMIDHSAFRYVVWHYVPVMLTIAMLYAIAWSRDRDAGAPWIVAGVFVTLAGAVIQQSGFTIHRWFNHNDLYHIVQIAGLWLFYQGLKVGGTP